MPERVRTLFDDEGNAASPNNLILELGIKPDPVPAPIRGKKRKRTSPKKGNSVENTTKKDLDVVQPRDAAHQQPKYVQNARTTNNRGYQSKDYVDGAGRNTGKSISGLREKKEVLLRFRRELPIWPQAKTIRDSLSGSKDVLILVGETGSGKSTQVPQFLLDEPWCKGCIAITQPRRVAAISLARRVAEEMGTPLGNSSPASKVGYSVRFDNSTSPSTRIKFLTEGTLLQEMLRDPWLNNYNAVIVDEVHERSVNVDLILGFLRNIVTGDSNARKGKPLKVVVMSATADVESLYKFFARGFGPLPNRTSPDMLEGTDPTWGGISSSEDESNARPTVQSNGAKSNGMNKNSAGGLQDTYADKLSTCYIQGRQFPVKIIYLPDPTQDFVEAALKAIFQIHYKEPLPGDVLVFLTGQDTIESLEKLINEYADAMGPEVPKVRSYRPGFYQVTYQNADPRFTAICSLAAGVTAESLQPSSS
jgi:ATP-dependent RNA helicase DHR2